MSKIGKIFLYNMISNISFFKLHVLCKSSSLRLIDDEDCFFTATKGMNYIINSISRFDKNKY